MRLRFVVTRATPLTDTHSCKLFLVKARLTCALRAMAFTVSLPTGAMNHRSVPASRACSCIGLDTSAPSSPRVVIMLGGDMIGLDLARTLIDTKHRVTLVAGPSTFWPHEVDDDERPALIAALEKMGVEVIEGADAGGIASIGQGAPGLSARRVVFRDGTELYGDVVMPFFGLSPSVEFMLGSGVDIERGLLVDPALRTTTEGIYAAGDVCQIWSDAERRYRFYYGWKNVRAMGDLAARNITGGDKPWAPAQDEKLHISGDGKMQSPFWEYA